MAEKNSTYNLLPAIIDQLSALKPFTRREVQSLFDQCMEGTNQELVYYMLGVCNILAQQNADIPDFVESLIQEYISSGEIEKVLANVLAGYMLNVKNPPEGLTPAVGDGTANDTEAIQGCIDYAYQNGGMAVYFPSGAYLCSALTLQPTTTLFGQDRYTTRVVLQGGATAPLISGTAEKLTVSGIGLDGNGDVQVNNVNLIDVTVDTAIFINSVLTDGYTLLKCVVNDDIQITDVIFDHAIQNSLDLSGDGHASVTNVLFKTISTLVGENYVVNSLDSSSFNGLMFVGDSANCILCEGDNNSFECVSVQTSRLYADNGTGNSFNFESIERNNTILGTDTITADTIARVTKTEFTETGSDRTANYSGTWDETVGAKIVNVTGNHAETNGTKSETVSGPKTETVNARKTLTVSEYMETVQNNKTENVQGDKTVTVGGDYQRTTSGAVTESDTGNTQTTVGDRTESFTNKTLTGTKLNIRTSQPVSYETPTVSENNPLFDVVPMLSENNKGYNVLVENDDTDALANLPERVSNLEGQSSLQVNRRMIWLYDSIGVGVFSPAYVTGFPTLIQQWGGFTLNENFFLAGASGTGFNPPDGSLKWENILSQYELPSSIAKSAITDIYVVGGDNDVTNLNVDDPSPLNTAIQSFMNYVKTNFPNAKVHVACIAYRLTGDNYKSAALNNVYSQCGRYGADFIENANFILHDTTFFGDDGIHVNQNGQNLLANYLLSVINGGGIEVTKQYRECKLIKQTWISGLGGSTNIAMEMHNNMIYCRMGTLNIDFSAFSGSNALDGVSTNVNAAILGDSYFYGDVSQTTVVTVPGFIIVNRSGSDEYVSCPIAVRFVNRNMFVAPIVARGSGGWETENGLRNISIAPCSFVIPAISS